jgi:hypothetical protein
MATEKGGLFQPAKDPVVVLVRAHPDPMKVVPNASGNGSIGTAYGNCPDLSFDLKLERGMKGVLLEEPLFLIRQLLDLMGQVGVESSKTLC